MQAIASGTIEKASNDPLPGFAGYGRVVVLRFRDADGSDKRALYAHLKRVDVVPGQTVAVGERLGEVGRSQFRTPASFQRSGRTVPQGYQQRLDDGGRYVARGGRPMAAHLHFEIARAAYPMGPEAPNRIDPRQWAIERGVLGGAPSAPRPASPPRLAARNAPPRPRVPSPAARAAAGNLRRADVERVRARIVAAVGQTEPQVALALSRIRSSSAPLAEAAASFVQTSWETSRAAILAAVRAPNPEVLRDAVREWSARLGTMLERARSLSLGPLVEIATRLKHMWDGLLSSLSLALRVASGAGAALAATAVSGWVLVALFMLAGQVIGGRAAYRYGRRRYREATR